jgi:hypothetical protein
MATKAISNATVEEKLFLRETVQGNFKRYLTQMGGSLKTKRLASLYEFLGIA